MGSELLIKRLQLIVQKDDRRERMGSVLAAGMINRRIASLKLIVQKRDDKRKESPYRHGQSSDKKLTADVIASSSCDLEAVQG